MIDIISVLQAMESLNYMMFDDNPEDNFDIGFRVETDGDIFIIKFEDFVLFISVDDVKEEKNSWVEEIYNRYVELLAVMYECKTKIEPKIKIYVEEVKGRPGCRRSDREFRPGSSYPDEE